MTTESVYNLADQPASNKDLVEVRLDNKGQPLVATQQMQQPPVSKPLNHIRDAAEQYIPNKPYLAVQDLVVGYDDTTVVKGLSLSLQQGEIGCFLGYSGCEKPQRYER